MVLRSACWLRYCVRMNTTEHTQASDQKLARIVGLAILIPGGIVGLYALAAVLGILPAMPWSALGQ